MLDRGQHSAGDAREREKCSQVSLEDFQLITSQNEQLARDMMLDRGQHSAGDGREREKCRQVSLQDFQLINSQNEQLSRDIQSHLGNFSRRLKSLEQNTLPLHQQTASLQTHQKNLELALKHLALVMSYYRAPQEYGSFISRQSIDNVPKFLHAMKEIKEAQQYFKHNNSAVPEMRQLDDHFARGNESLFAFFRSELHQTSEPNEMLMWQLEVMAAQFVQGQNSMHRQSTQSNTEMDLVPASKISDLRDVSYWLCRGLSDKFDVVSSYAAKRSEFLVRSLVSFVERYRIQAVTSTVNANDFDFLRTYQTTEMPHVPRWRQRRKNRLTRAVAVNPSLHMEAAGLGSDTVMGSILGKTADNFLYVIDSGVEGVKKIGEITSDVVLGTGDVVTKLASETADVVTTGLSSTASLMGMNLGFDSDSSKSCFLSLNNLEEFDLMVYIHFISAFHQLCLHESKLLNAIIPRNKEVQCFDTLCKEAAKRLRGDIDNLVTACVTRLRTLKTDLLAISCLLPLAEFLRVFFFCSGLSSGENNSLPLSLQKEYYILYRKCLDAIKICMAEFLENVKSESTVDKTIPSDATVHELSVKVMTCLEYVLFYKSVFAITQGLPGSQYSSMEQQQLQGNDEFKCPGALYQLPAGREMESVSSYFARLCGNLSVALSQKIISVDETRGNLFIFNNLTFIVKSIEKSDVQHISQDTRESFVSAFVRQIHNARTSFMQCWRKLNSHISAKPPNIAPSELVSYMEKISLGKTDQIKMQDVERESLKNLFATLNSEFGGVHTVHKTLSIPDETTHREVHQEIERIVIRPYIDFYNKYEKLPFTKFREKYIKYTPAEFVQCVEECYSQF